MIEPDDFTGLPPKAIIAFAARCARRVQPLYARADKIPNHIKGVRALERAVQQVEMFQLTPEIKTDKGLFEALGTAATASENAYDCADECLDDAHGASKYFQDAQIAECAVFAAKSVMFAVEACLALLLKNQQREHPDLSHIESAYAAYQMSVKASPEAEYAAKIDLTFLKEAVDYLAGDAAITPNLFGDRWPNGEPAWYSTSWEKQVRILYSGNSEKIKGREIPEIQIYIDPGNASKDAIQEVLAALNELHFQEGGFGFEFVADDRGIHVEAVKQ